MFRLSHEGNVARLTIDRPEARNAIPAARWRWLAAAAGEVAQSDARLLVLTGTGGAFCAGADVKDFAGMLADEAARIAFRTDMRAALDALSGLAIPTIAAIDGPCFGAGVALALSCDLRIATAAARFAITPAKMGISFPQEDVHRLVSLIGIGNAARLLITAAPIDGVEAARMGLVELCGEGTDELVAAILNNDKDALFALKRAIRLAGEGVRSSAAQDKVFDDLIGGASLASRLEGWKRT
jgi:enoyl-CoA hydratase/carnithine racemase